MKSWIAGSLLALLGLALADSPVWAGKVGPEFQVNRYTTNDQSWPSVAGLTGGGFVVVWTSYEQDGFEEGVYGQRYGSDGRRAGPEFRANTFRKFGQSAPAVAGLSGGGFVVTWSSVRSNTTAGIYGQAFDSAGAKVGTEFEVSTASQLASSVAGLTGGGFVVTFFDGAELSDVYAQRYNSTGGRVGHAVLVNRSTGGTQDAARVASLPNDGFVVTWQSADDSSWGIYGQRCDGAGKRVGRKFLVNRYTINKQYNPSIASLPGGGFVISWQSVFQDGDSLEGIFAQRYDSAGHRAGPELHVNTYTDDVQAGPSVAGLNDGGFVITWQSYGADPDESAGAYGQRYDNAGRRVQGNFRANTETAGFQGLASVASLSGGGFVVTWTSSNDQDGSGDGVFGQRYAP